jgi:hypothetical protein
MESILKSIYNDISSPGGYAGIDALHREARKRGHIVSMEDVVKFLQGQTTYTLFKPRKLKYARSATIPLGYFSDAQADLAGSFGRVNHR